VLFWVFSFMANAAPPVDSLGGITVGSLINKQEMRMCEPHVCMGKAAIAGESGSILVMLCGERATHVSFNVKFISTADTLSGGRMAA
jgi:hypothetical protein